MSTPYDADLSREEQLLDVNIDWDVDSMATFDAVVEKARSLGGFDRIQIYRDDAEIFDGRQEKPKINFGSKGRYPMNIAGFDWTRRLIDFPTASQEIVDSTTADALTDILSETDFGIDIDGEFEYITPLEEWLTYIDLIMKMDNYYRTGIELDLTLDDAEISQEVMVANTYTLCNIGLKSCFFYDFSITNKRLYVFAKNSTNDLYYYHSQDGVTWTAVDTTKNPFGNAWSVGWSGSEVYLFYYDGANTDFSLGIINDITGTIGWTDTANIFPDFIRFGPVFDDDWHVWVIINTGIAYESTDGGLTWNNMFGLVPPEKLWGLAQVGSDGDMIGIVLDTANTDLEEWLWDRSAGTFTFTQKIKDEDDVDGLDLCQDFVLNIYLAYNDGNNLYLNTNQSGAWADVTVTNLAALSSYSIASDRRNSYIIYSNAGGVNIKKYYGVTLSETWANNDTLVSTSPFVSTTRACQQDGERAIFFTTINNWDRVHFIVLHQRGIRLAEGYTAGDFHTNTITASGGMTSWGMLTGDGELIDDGESILWDIYSGATLLVDDEVVPFDLKLAGVPDATASIVIYGYLDDNGVDPYVKEFEVTEKTDNVSLSTDYEDAYTGIDNLAELAGAEYYVTFDGTMWTLHFTTRRGEDKSSYITLKASSTNLFPDLEPNIKVLDKAYDWAPYANVVRFVGGEDINGNRVVAEVRDNAEIAAKGQEYWKTIRDPSVTTKYMARQRAYVELIRSNSVSTSMFIEFLDKHVTNDVEIGDSVYVAASWDDEGLDINGSYRIMKIHRQWGTSGEIVTGELNNRLRYASYWNYIKKTDDHDRWLTA